MISIRRLLGSHCSELTYSKLFALLLAIACIAAMILGCIQALKLFLLGDLQTSTLNLASYFIKTSLVNFFALLMPVFVIGTLFLKYPKIWAQHFQIVGVACGLISVYLVGFAYDVIEHSILRLSAPGSINLFILITGLICGVIAVFRVTRAFRQTPS